jgi:hypothetical protein
LFLYASSSQSHVFNAQNGFAGNFKHTQAGQGITLFEISVKTDDNNIYYDLSVINGFNVPMKVQAPDGYDIVWRMFTSICCFSLFFLRTHIQALNAQAPDAYLFPTDDSKTHGLTQEGKFTVTFEG